MKLILCAVGVAAVCLTWVAPAAAQCGTTTTTTSTTTTTLRFVDNGDGTVTDHQTGLIWEKKVAGSSCLHCVDDSYNWSFSGAAPDGLAFTSFLNTLNGGATGAGNCVSPDGSSITGGFNGHCDWRLPSIVELQTIVDLSATGCPRSPCIDPIFGPTGGGGLLVVYDRHRRLGLRVVRGLRRWWAHVLRLQDQRQTRARGAGRLVTAWHGG